MKCFFVIATIFLFLVAGNCVTQAQEKTAGDKYVGRKEYEKLKNDNDQLKSDFDALKLQMQEFIKKGEAKPPESKSELKAEDINASFDEIDKRLNSVEKKNKGLTPGSSKFLLSGFGFVTYTVTDRTPSTFYSELDPLFAWEVNDRILWETALIIGLNGLNVTTLDMEFNQGSYIINDYMTLVGGKMPCPFGTFSERLDPDWINLFPDHPLCRNASGSAAANQAAPLSNALPPTFLSGLAPSEVLGAQVRGGFPIGDMRGNYAFYVANGPVVNDGSAGMNGGTVNPQNVGVLQFNNYTDIQNNKAYGGRVGYLPIPKLEIGYSFEYAPSSGHGTSTMLNGVDLSIKRDSPFCMGMFDFRSEWIWSHVSNTTYDSDGALGYTANLQALGLYPNGVNFQNDRQGGYFQLGYRPTKIDMPIIKNLELVFRYDAMISPSQAPMNVQERRWSIGLDYWFNPSTVLKLALELDHEEGGFLSATTDPANPIQNFKALDSNSVIVEFATGF